MELLRKTLPELYDGLSEYLIDRKITWAELSRKIGVSYVTLLRKMKSKSPPIGILLDISNALEINLLDRYLILLPKHIRQTQDGRNLVHEIELKQAELDALKQELAQVKKEKEKVEKERDKYWDAIMARFK